MRKVQRNTNKKTFLYSIAKIAAVIGTAILLLGMMAPAVSAKEVTAYAYKAQDVKGTDGKIHKGLFYIIPHTATPYPLKIGDSCPTATSPCYKPYVGGVRQDLLNSIPFETHKDPQKWEYFSRTQRNQYTDETILMIPTGYALFNWNYANEINIKVTYS